MATIVGSFGAKSGFYRPCALDCDLRRMDSHQDTHYAFHRAPNGDENELPWVLLHMRTVAIPIYNNQTLEIFTERRSEPYTGFGVWMVGIAKGERMILDQFITHEDLERRLSYARTGDLAWTDAELTALPHLKSAIAREAEEIMRKGKFLDLADIGAYFGAVRWLDQDRKVGNTAKKAILGRWTDGLATIALGANSTVRIDCPTAASHPLYHAAHVHKVDWWSFKPWTLVMLNDERKTGGRTGVFRCDERELHMAGGQRDALVHIFHRDTSL